MRTNKNNRRTRRTVKRGGGPKRKKEPEENDSLKSSKLERVDINEIDLQVPPDNNFSFIDLDSSFGMLFKKHNRIYKFVFICATYRKIDIGNKTKTCTDDMSGFLKDSELQTSLFKQSTSERFHNLPFQGTPMPICPQVFPFTENEYTEYLNDFFPGVTFEGVKHVGLIVMEYIVAEPFHTDTFTPQVIINILAQLLRLYVIHEVIHTDMKFDNVLIKEGTDYPYLIDISTKPSYRVSHSRIKIFNGIVFSQESACSIISEIKAIIIDMSTYNEDLGYIELSFYKSSPCRTIMSSNEYIMEVYFKYLEYSGLKTVEQLEEEIKPMLNGFDYSCSNKPKQQIKQEEQRGCIIA